MSQIVLGSSPDSSTVAYASMASSPPLDDKTSAAFQAQPKPVLQVQEGKGDAASIRAQADASYKNGESAYNEGNYHTSYLHYLQAKSLYEQLPQDESTIKKLATTYYDLAWLASQLRDTRRSAVKNLLWTLFIPCCWPFSLCVGCALKSTNWVGNNTFREYVDTGLQLIDQLILAIQQKHSVQMGTDKNSIPDPVRKELGWAYNKKASFYSILDSIPEDGVFYVASDCCFEGNNGRVDASRHDNATTLANLKLAKEWDPSKQQYEAEYQKLDAYMKRPIINVTYHRS
jgi:hypothetical protein